MEQKSQEQTSVIIKEEIAETNFSFKENTNTQRITKSTLKEGSKDTSDNTECSSKIERNTSPTTTINSRSSVVCKNTLISQPSSMNVSSGPTIFKNVLTNFPIRNSCSVDALSPPLISAACNNNITLDFEQTPVSTKSSYKVKRLLSTLLQFANSLNAEVGESVKTLIFNLACNVITIEDFHNNLQDTTNFPLRPFVLPFLKNYIPILQKEVVVQAKMAKQNIQQYVRQHENCILESFCPSSELSEVFNQMETVSSSNQPESCPNTFPCKRRYDCQENNVACHKADSPTDPPTQNSPPIKKPTTSNMYSSLINSLPCLINNQQTSYCTSEYFQIPPPPFLSSGSGLFCPSSLSSTKDFNLAADDNKNTDDNEWNNIYVMLNCILSMVEKTKRALTILQERNAHDYNCADVNGQGTNINVENGDHGSVPRRTTAEDIKRTANELMVHTVRLTEEKVAFVRRKAEEAVNEVKRQAILELQKTIATTDYKITECGATNQVNKTLTSENKKFIPDSEQEYAGHNGFQLNDKLENVFSFSQTNNCWNCGRKAQETCSGCNLARYCGSFCQYKDWESHHHSCNAYIISSLNNFEKTSFPRSSYSDSLLRNNTLNDFLSKSNAADLANIIRSQKNSMDMSKLLPFSINMTTVSSEKLNVTRTWTSRPLTPIVTTTSAVKPLISTKIKK